MKKIIISLITAAVFLPSLRADEGMWLLPLLEKINSETMRNLGSRLTPEQIYSINNSSIKDAVVQFGGGCTGEIISGSGLLVTNHHCGYSSIQRLSSETHNYLEDGYWAMDRSEEIPVPGLSVTFLQKMWDVTEQTKDLDASEALVEKVKAENPNCEVRIVSFFNSNVRYIVVNKVYRDVRFVGAPPAASGKFGGDTDNWMWPRHTGDFSIFRIYAGKDNAPAAYSEDNVPYRPKKYFKISTAGVGEGDFTFIYGFPGTTREYITSDAVRYISEVSDPAKIDLRTQRLDIQKKHMSQSQDVRIRYSAKNASVSNAWKKWQGEMKGIRKMHTVDTKKEYEARFDKWAAGTKYEGLLDTLGVLYRQLEPCNYALEYTLESALAVELPKFAYSYATAKEEQRESLKESFYKDWYLPIDRETFIAMMSSYSKNVPDAYKPAYFFDKIKEYDGNLEAWTDAVFSSALGEGDCSGIADSEAYSFRKAFRDHYNEVLYPEVQRLNSAINRKYKSYMQGQMEFSPEKAFYPDANLTLRVAYGKVSGYEPADGIRYKEVSTLSGIMEKDNPDIFDYNIPQRLRDLYATGQYDDIPVCFIATNHTTGGNSGSPVINADGNLIGINFDRVWEGTMSDVAFDPEFCRNICLDIRYLLFVTDKVCGAGSLLKELEFVD